MKKISPGLPKYGFVTAEFVTSVGGVPSSGKAEPVQLEGDNGNTLLFEFNIIVGAITLLKICPPCGSTYWPHLFEKDELK